MNSYFLILIADLLLASTFALQKKYQDKAGTAVKASLLYTILSSMFTAVTFLTINRFTVRVTLFSIVMAILYSGILTVYIFLGFRVMKRGNMSLYTLFLMSGGMTIPYLYGVLFLNEELNIARTLGLILIIVAIAVANFSKGKVDRKQLALCVAVFLLNGAASVISKVHQISGASEIVTSSDFVFLMSVSKVVINGFVLLFRKEEMANKLPVSIKSVIPIVFIVGVADGVCYLLQLIGAVNIPATVLYPLITGGTIVLSTFIDFAFCKGKISSKQWIGTGVAFLGTFMFL